MLRQQKWDILADHCAQVYPKLIRLFYCNAFFKEGNEGNLIVYSMVKGVKWMLIGEKVNRLFNMHVGGYKHKEYRLMTSLGKRVLREEISRMLCGGTVLDVNSLSMTARALGGIIAQFVQYRGQKQLTIFYFILIFKCMKMQVIDFGEIFVRNIHLGKRQQGRALPHGGLLTRMMHLMGVDMEGESMEAITMCYGIHNIESVRHRRDKEAERDSFSGNVDGHEDNQSGQGMNACHRFKNSAIAGMVSDLVNLITRENEKQRKFRKGVNAWKAGVEKKLDRLIKHSACCMRNKVTNSKDEDLRKKQNGESKDSSGENTVFEEGSRAMGGSGERCERCERNCFQETHHEAVHGDTTVAVDEENVIKEVDSLNNRKRGGYCPVYDLRILI